MYSFSFKSLCKPTEDNMPTKINTMNHTFRQNLGVSIKYIIMDSQKYNQND